MRYLERSEMRIASPCQGEAAPSARVRVRIPGCPCARWAAIWNLDPHPTLVEDRGAAGTAARPTVGGGAPYCWIS
jgi:hypothetical protein